MSLYVDIRDDLHDRVNNISLNNYEVVERALKLYLSDQWASEAEQEAALVERRAEWHDSEADRLRELAAEHEQDAADAREKAAELRADAEIVPDSVRDAGESAGFEELVTDLHGFLSENPDVVVWPGHGRVESVVADTGAPAEAVLAALKERGVEESRLRDAPLGGDL